MHQLIDAMLPLLRSFRRARVFENRRYSRARILQRSRARVMLCNVLRSSTAWRGAKANQPQDKDVKRARVTNTRVGLARIQSDVYTATMYLRPARPTPAPRKPARSAVRSRAVTRCGALINLLGHIFLRLHNLPRRRAAAALSLLCKCTRVKMSHASSIVLGGWNIFKNFPGANSWFLHVIFDYLV